MLTVEQFVAERPEAATPPNEVESRVQYLIGARITSIIARDLPDTGESEIEIRTECGGVVFTAKVLGFHADHMRDLPC